MNILSEEKHGGKTPTEMATGHTLDISAYVDHKFFDPNYNYDHDEKYLSTKEQLER